MSDLARYEEGPDGNYYRHYRIHKAYEDAKYVCMSQGASLPIADSSKTQHFINAQYPNDDVWLAMTYDDGGSGGVGGGAAARGGRWQWTRADGTKSCILAYKNWKVGDPNRDGASCVVNERKRGWNDVSCGNNGIVLCQMPGETKGFRRKYMIMRTYT